MSTEKDPAPAGPQKGVESPVTPPPATPAEPFAVFSTKEAFDERVERAAKAAAKKSLGLDPEEAKTRLARLVELEAAEDERKKAAMSEAERTKAELDKLRAETEAAKAEAARATFEASTARLFARHGVKDDEYGTFRIRQAEAAAKTSGETFDAEKFLTTIIADARERVKLGIDDVAAPGAAAPPAVRGTTPATTTNAPNVQGTPPPAGTPKPQKSAMDMTPEEWRRHLSSLGTG